MRIAHVLTLAAAAAVSFSASADSGAVAAAATAAAANTAPHVKAVPIYKPSRAESQRMQGAYQLDDGRVLRVTTAHGKLYAELDGKRKEIVAAGPNRFSSRDDAVRVRFDPVTAAGEVAVSVPRA